MLAAVIGKLTYGLLKPAAFFSPLLSNAFKHNYSLHLDALHENNLDFSFPILFLIKGRRVVSFSLVSFAYYVLVDLLILFLFCRRLFLALWVQYGGVSTGIIGG